MIAKTSAIFQRFFESKTTVPKSGKSIDATEKINAALSRDDFALGVFLMFAAAVPLGTIADFLFRTGSLATFMTVTIVIFLHGSIVRFVKKESSKRQHEKGWALSSFISLSPYAFPDLTAWHRTLAVVQLITAMATLLQAYNDLLTLISSLDAKIEDLEGKLKDRDDKIGRLTPMADAASEYKQKYDKLYNQALNGGSIIGKSIIAAALSDGGELPLNALPQGDSRLRLQ